MGKLFFVVLVMQAVPAIQAGHTRDGNNNPSFQAADPRDSRGELEVGNYDLANVVVVAPQGGDFDDPIVALQWVESQSPSSSNRFLVFLAPGKYQLGSPLQAPSYTTLRGCSTEQCIIERTGTNSAVMFVDGKTHVTFENLTFVKGYLTGSATQNYGIRVENSTSVVFRNCRIDFRSRDYYGFCLSVVEDGVKSAVELINTDLACIHESPGDYSTSAIDCRGNVTLVARNSSITVDHRSATGSAYCVRQISAATDAYSIKVHGSRLISTSVSGDAYFFLRSGQGEAYFYNSHLVGDSVPSADDVWFVRCFTDTGAYP